LLIFVGQKNEKIAITNEMMFRFIIGLK
jgi:hypothetical protein